MLPSELNLYIFNTKNYMIIALCSKFKKKLFHEDFNQNHHLAFKAGHLRTIRDI